MKIVGVIPARYNSSRFPGKPLEMILGKTLIQRVYENAKKVSEFDRVIIATDDKRIKQFCKKHDMDVMLTSSKHKTGTDRVAEVANKIHADYYVNIQGDEPLVTPETIRCAIQSEYPVVNLMTKIRDNAELDDDTVPKIRLGKNNQAINLSRYISSKYKQIGVYGFTSDALKQFSTLSQTSSEKVESIEILRFVENDIPVYMVEVKQDTVAVDIPSDIQKVENAKKRQRYEAIIFDFDGTLVDSENIKTAAFKKLFIPYSIENFDMNLQEGGRSRYEKIPYFFRKLLDISLTKEQVEAIAKNYSDLVFDEIVDAPYINGVKEFLDCNKGIVDMFIVSGTPTDELRQILKKRGMLHYFKGTYGADDDKENIIRDIIGFFDYNPARVLHVGDKILDFVCSKKTGVNFLGINNNGTNTFPAGVTTSSKIGDDLWLV